ncbi:MAG: cellulase family glycosylhydrolase [Anaerolineae bacterium]|nr:cellulase family glycosylhydrolase [Anaerolineae bacterium]
MIKSYLILLFAIILLAGCGATMPAENDDLVGPDPITQVFDSPEYGMHTALWWNVSDGSIPDLELVRDMGFSWVKQKFAWRDIENIKKGEYDHYRTDRIVEEVEKEGLKLLVRIDRQPLWAQDQQETQIENGPSADYQDFGDFCGWLADRYKGRIHAYQVWNEPNLHREWGWQPPNPVQYTELLKTCYTAIKAADPDAIVISAGLAPTGAGDPSQVMSDTDFLRGMYAAGAADYFDVLGVNAPGYKAPPDLDPEIAATAQDENGLYTYGGHRFFSFRHVEDLRRIMLEYGDGATQMAIMEMGWTTDTRPESPYAWHAVDETTQADYLVGAYEYAREHWQPWMGLMTSLYIADFNWTPEEDEQWWWAIAFPDGTTRPAYAALKAMPK